MNSPSFDRVAFAPLLRAAEGLTQWRPLVLGFATWVLCAALMSAGMYLASRMGGSGVVLAALVGLATAVVAAAGFSGVGVMLMDKARNLPVRSLVDAFWSGLLCLPKLIGFALVLVVITLALALVGTLVYFVCKLPGVGPLLLFVLHPVLVLLAAVVFTAMGWVAVPLYMPAVWEGRGFKESLSLVLAVARSRLVQVVALLLGLYLVMAIVAMLVSLALLPGYGFMSGLAASVLGVGAGLGGMPSMMGMMGGMGGGGLLVAGMLSSVLIFGVVATLLGQVFLMGLCLVYLSATEGVDIAAGQQMLDAGIAQARERAQQAQERARQAAALAQEKAREAAERSRQAMHKPTAPEAAPEAAPDVVPEAPPAAPSAPVPPASSAPTPEPPAAAVPLHCPECRQEVAASDLFCGHCGHRM